MVTYYDSQAEMNDVPQYLVLSGAKFFYCHKKKPAKSEVINLESIWQRQETVGEWK